MTSPLRGTRTSLPSVASSPEPASRILHKTAAFVILRANNRNKRTAAPQVRGHTVCFQENNATLFCRFQVNASCFHASSCQSSLMTHTPCSQAMQATRKTAFSGWPEVSSRIFRAASRDWHGPRQLDTSLLGRLTCHSEITDTPAGIF